MRKALYATLAVFLGAAQSAPAQELILESDHSYFQAEMTERDLACQNAALASLTKRYDGIESLTINGSNYWTSVVTNVENYAFPNSTIVSEHGNVEAQIVCLVYTQANAIIEVSFQFQPSLKGTKIGGGSQYGTPNFVSQSTVQITGAN